MTGIYPKQKVGYRLVSVIQLRQINGREVLDGFLQPLDPDDPEAMETDLGTSRESSSSRITMGGWVGLVLKVESRLFQNLSARPRAEPKPWG